MKKIGLLFALLILLAGCSEKGTRIENTTTLDEDKLKSTLNDNKHVKLAIALMDEKDMIVGIRVNTFSRFQKKKIASDISKKLQKHYPDQKITVSADSKVLLETEKLINKGKRKEYQKKIEHIKSIEKEQT